MGDASGTADPIDWSYVARGASTGFTVLFVGGLLYPLVLANVPGLGIPWQLLVAAAGFAAAGCRIGRAGSPPVHGAVAAVAGYVLVLPLILITGQGLDVRRLGLMLLGAVVMGAAAGQAAGRAARGARTERVRRPGGQ